MRNTGQIFCSVSFGSQRLAQCRPYRFLPFKVRLAAAGEGDGEAEASCEVSLLMTDGLGDRLADAVLAMHAAQDAVGACLRVEPVCSAGCRLVRRACCADHEGSTKLWRLTHRTKRFCRKPNDAALSSAADALCSLDLSRQYKWFRSTTCIDLLRLHKL